MSLNVLIAPSGFKESLDAPDVARAIAQGVFAALPTATIRIAPVADGGEGFTRAVVAATDGWALPVAVTGPTGRPVQAEIGFCGETADTPRTAVLEMAAAAGLRLVPRDERDPQRTTTFGVGELVRAALDHGARRIVIGCGDSGTNDGGLGFAAALGVRFLDADGHELEPVGASLAAIDRIDVSGLDPRLADVDVEVACNITNVLCGERGVARVFGPQKGASAATVDALAAGLDHYAARVHAVTGVDVASLPGAGASGGLGAGLAAFAGARLTPRWEVITRYLDLESLIRWSDLVFTAEGSVDGQTPNGKIPAELGRRARATGIPVIVLAGQIGDGAHLTHDAGISAYTSVVQKPCSLAEAMASTERLVSEGAEQAMRLVLVGRRLAA